MESITFQNYSSTLQPLPPLNSGGTQTDPGPSTSDDASFREQLEGFLGQEVAGPDRTHQPPGWPFDLGAERPRTPSESQSAALHPPTYPPRPELRPLTGTGMPVESAGDGLMQVCKDIEGFLLGLLLRNLGQSFGGSNLFSRTWESSVYRDMFFSELARTVGGSGPGMGIAEVLYHDITLRAGVSS